MEEGRIESAQSFGRHTSIFAQDAQARKEPLFGLLKPFACFIAETRACERRH
jgi:hypothetical protein